MLRFKQFIILTEGGNVTVEYQGKRVGADPIDLHQRSRKQVTSGIRGFLSALHDEIHNISGEHLFGKNKVALSKGTTFGGSTRPLMDQKISDDVFINKMGKNKVGDIDTLVKPEHIQPGGPLDRALQPGKKYNKFTVIGRTNIGTSLHAIVRNDGTGDHHQIDFAGVPYEGNHPSMFSQVAYGSHPDDMMVGLKGADHTTLLTSAIKAAEMFEGNVVAKSGKNKGKITEQGPLPRRTFSIAYGMRPSHRELGGGLAEKINPAKTPIHYTTDLKEISRQTFGVPNGELDSFHGVARTMKKYFNHRQIADTIRLTRKSMEETPEAASRLPKAMGVLHQFFGDTHPDLFPELKRK